MYGGPALPDSTSSRVGREVPVGMARLSGLDQRSMFPSSSVSQSDVAGDCRGVGSGVRFQNENAGCSDFLRVIAYGKSASCFLTLFSPMALLLPSTFTSPMDGTVVIACFSTTNRFFPSVLCCDLLCSLMIKTRRAGTGRSRCGTVSGFF